MANNRKLGRATDHRMAMLRALVTYLLENGKVETTLARAKEVGPLTEKMITLVRAALWLIAAERLLSSPRKTL